MLVVTAQCGEHADQLCVENVENKGYSVIKKIISYMTTKFSVFSNMKLCVEMCMNFNSDSDIVMIFFIILVKFFISFELCPLILSVFSLNYPYYSAFS